MEVRMSIIAWIILGAIAGYLAGFLVKGDEGLGVIGHIVLGIVGALVGGFLASVLFNVKPIDGAFEPDGSRSDLTHRSRRSPLRRQLSRTPTSPGGRSDFTAHFIRPT